MTKNIELPYSIGDRVWGIVGTTIAVEADIVGYEITENYKTPIRITYSTKSVNDGKSYDFKDSELYPSKSAIILQLEEYENLRHNEVLTKLKCM